MKLLQGVAVLMGVVLLVLTVVPAAERPVTGLQHDLEHFAAFALCGMLVAGSFEAKTSLLVLAGAAYSLLLECLQIPLPTRHARFEDFIVDSIAFAVGVLFVRISRSYLRR
jgi:VanZ family protein